MKTASLKKEKLNIQETQNIPKKINSPGRLASPKMEELLASPRVKGIPKPGDLVEGKVINVTKNEILIDIDGLSCGVVRGPELYDESGEYSDLKVGDLVEATLLELENERGLLEFSLRQAGHKRAWRRLKELKEKGEVISALALEANRGGLVVRIEKVMGFLPLSQLSIEHYPRVEGGDKNKILEKLRKFIGQTLKVKIIDLQEENEEIIVSEKEAFEKEKQEALAKYKVGDIIEGEISGITNFGAFVKFGKGLEGLVHISEIAWQRIDTPHEIIRLGEKVKAQIISLGRDKISLSIKKLKEDPWAKVEESYKVGQVIKGKVLKLDSFGAFVRLDKNIRGLAHISELSSKPINHPLEVVKVGQEYKFKILSIEPKDHRLGLSIRALEEE